MTAEGDHISSATVPVPPPVSIKNDLFGIAADDAGNALVAIELEAFIPNVMPQASAIQHLLPDGTIAATESYEMHPGNLGLLAVPGGVVVAGATTQPLTFDGTAIAPSGQFVSRRCPLSP